MPEEKQKQNGKNQGQASEPNAAARTAKSGGESATAAKSASLPVKELLDPKDFPVENIVKLKATGKLANFSFLNDVPVTIAARLGQVYMQVHDILTLRPESVITLDKLAGDAVDIYVNDILLAKGEVLILNEAFCIRITEILSPKDRLAHQFMK